jgi:hypothetical protein
MIEITHHCDGCRRSTTIRGDEGMPLGWAELLITVEPFPEAKEWRNICPACVKKVLK